MLTSTNPDDEPIRLQLKAQSIEFWVAMRATGAEKPRRDLLQVISYTFPIVSTPKLDSPVMPTGSNPLRVSRHVTG